MQSNNFSPSGVYVSLTSTLKNLLNKILTLSQPSSLLPQCFLDSRPTSLHKFFCSFLFAMPSVWVEIAISAE